MSRVSSADFRYGTRAGRDPSEIGLAVSKARSASSVREAFDAGQTVFVECLVHKILANEPPAAFGHVLALHMPFAKEQVPKGSLARRTHPCR